ncbi:hypothetical protein Bca4012_085445 [Brassica carinata]
MTKDPLLYVLLNCNVSFFKRKYWTLGLQEKDLRETYSRHNCTPKYVQTGYLLIKTDLYGLGVVLNQIITRHSNQ